MRLSSEQVDQIGKYLKASGITLTSLHDDVLDHICCVLESQPGDADFDAALKRAISELAPNGLASLQNETFYLLNSEKIKNMKKLMFLIGFGSSAALTMGILFKLLHWPGGDELVTYGFITFALLFVPLLMVDRFKIEIKSALSERLRILLGTLSGLLGGLAVVFKILHLTGGDILLIAAALIFSFGFLPFLFFTMYRKSVVG